MKPAEEGSPKIPRWKIVLGWIAVVLNLLTACLWSFWGGVEAFHEGWWMPTLWGCILQSLAYLAPGAIFVALGLVAATWPRVGAIAVFGFTVWFWWFFDVSRWMRGGNVFGIIASGAFGLFILLWWFGVPEPKKLARLLTWCVPLVVAVVSMIYPASFALTRVNDGDFGARRVKGNGVDLIWAPQGPGWPIKGGPTWEQAMETADRLSADGLRVMDTPQHIWRLPTLDEAVRSSARHGVSVEGRLEGKIPRYSRQPDKETPLWNPQSEVIYWWVADHDGKSHAWSYCFNGSVLSRYKKGPMGSLAFRAVKSPPSASSPRK